MRCTPRSVYMSTSQRQSSTLMATASIIARKGNQDSIIKEMDTCNWFMYTVRFYSAVNNKSVSL